jgi:small GTP-binding protein
MRPILGQKFKVVIVGDQFVGKTSFLSYLTKQHVPPDLSPTTSLYLTMHEFTINGKSYSINIWDTAGEEQYRSLASVYLRNARGVLVMFDLTRQSSFDSVDYWINYITDTLENLPALLIIGNKSDIRDLPLVEDDTINSYCQWKGVKCMRTSAYTGENVELSFSTLMELVLQEKAEMAISPSLQFGKSPKQRFCC